MSDSGEITLSEKSAHSDRKCYDYADLFDCPIKTDFAEVSFEIFAGRAPSYLGLTPTRVGVFMRKAMNLSLDGKSKTGTGHKMQLNRAHVGKSFDQP